MRYRAFCLFPDHFVRQRQKRTTQCAKVPLVEGQSLLRVSDLPIQIVNPHDRPILINLNDLSLPGRCFSLLSGLDLVALVITFFKRVILCATEYSAAMRFIAVLSRAGRV